MTDLNTILMHAEFYLQWARDLEEKGDFESARHLRQQVSQLLELYEKLSKQKGNSYEKS